MRRVWDIFVYGIVVAGILVLTANANGANFVSSLGGAVTGFAGAITGRTVSSGKGTTSVSGTVG